jgi:hypothetical protein
LIFQKFMKYARSCPKSNLAWPRTRSKIAAERTGLALKPANAFENCGRIPCQMTHRPFVFSPCSFIISENDQYVIVEHVLCPSPDEKNSSTWSVFSRLNFASFAKIHFSRIFRIVTKCPLVSSAPIAPRLISIHSLSDSASAGSGTGLPCDFGVSIIIRFTSNLCN